MPSCAVDFAHVAQADHRIGFVTDPRRVWCKSAHHASHRCRFSATKESSARSAWTRHTRSISSLWPGSALVRVQAPDAFEQALAAQHLVAAGDAAVEIVGDVEEGGVAIGDARIEREDVGGTARPPTAACKRSSRRTAPCVQTDQCPSRPPRKRGDRLPSRMAVNGVTRSSTM